MVTLSELTQSWREIEARNGTAGSDGVTVADFRKRPRALLKELAAEIASGTYRTSPARIARIPKEDGDIRHISILCVRDRVVHHAVHRAIRPILEPGMSEACHAYRFGRGVKSAVTFVRDAKANGYDWAFSGDIASYFDSIDARQILSRTDAWLPPKLAVLLRACIEPLAVGGRGIPQGSAISPALSNIYLDTFDAELSELGPLARYADNFVCMAKDRTTAEQIMSFASRALAELSLKLNPKSAVLPACGMAFLGETI